MAVHRHGDGETAGRPPARSPARSPVRSPRPRARGAAVRGGGETEWEGQARLLALLHGNGKDVRLAARLAARAALLVGGVSLALDAASRAAAALAHAARAAAAASASAGGGGPRAPPVPPVPPPSSLVRRVLLPSRRSAGDAARLAVAAGVLVGVFKATRPLLARLLAAAQPDRPRSASDEERGARVRSGLPSFGSGFLAALLAVLIIRAGERRSWALLVLVRAAEVLYRSALRRGVFTPPALLAEHGDALLFMAGTAQVMLAYVIAPFALPAAYYRFILHTGPLSDAVLRAFRRASFGKPVDVEQVAKFYRASGGPANFGPFPLARDAAYIPCSVAHPHARSHVAAVLLCFRRAFLRSLPVYTMVFAGSAAVSYRRTLRAPLATVLSKGVSILRSTTFLAAFNGLCMAQLCLTRAVVSVERPVFYWFNAFLAATAIFIEKKSRRKELALYVLPRALDSLWLLISHSPKAPSTSQPPRIISTLRAVRGVPEILFSISVATMLMHYDARSPCLPPFLRSVFDFAFAPSRPALQIRHD